MNSLIITALACVSLGYAQTRIDLRYHAKYPDFSAMTHTRPVQVGATLPTSCLDGELFVNSTAPAGQALYICDSANTWSPVSSAATSLGGCTVDVASDLSCPGNFFSGTGSVAGILSLFEVASNGNNAISLAAPDSIPTAYTLQLPSLSPQSGQVLQFGSPSNGVSSGSWVSASAGVSPSIVATYLTPPSCSSSNPGQIYVMPAGAGISGYCDGSSIHWLFEGRAIVPPGPAGAYSAQQAPATIDNPDGSLYLLAASGSGDVLKALTAPVSGGQTTWTFYYRDIGWNAYTMCGPLIQDSTNIYIAGVKNGYPTAAPPSGLVIDTWSSFSSIRTSGSPLTPPFQGSGIKMIRIHYNAASGAYEFYVTPDGLNWRMWASQPAAGAPTNFGWGCTVYGTSNGDAAMTVYSAVAQ